MWDFHEILEAPLCPLKASLSLSSGGRWDVVITCHVHSVLGSLLNQAASFHALGVWLAIKTKQKAPCWGLEESFKKDLH